MPRAQDAGRLTFDDAPRDDSLRALEDAQPENPFATAAYARARERLGARVCMLSQDRTAASGTSCLGFLALGRVHRTLEIPSLPGNATAAFVTGLLDASRARGITTLDLNTFASPAISIPRLPRERRRERREWLIDLSRGDWQKDLATNHRRNVERARKSGCSVRRAGTPQDVEIHARLAAASMDRRARRGEATGAAEQRALIRAMLDSGCAQLFQAVLDGRVVSSVCIMLARHGAYYQSAGTSPDGMTAGASPFLVVQAAEMLRGEGRRVLNLGDASAANAGLQRFKSGFGARPIELAAVQSHFFSLWKAPVATALFYARIIARTIR